MYKFRKHIMRYAILLVLLFAILIVPNFHNETYPEAILCGTPVFTTEYSDFAKLSIDQILNADDIVYVLYDDHRGIIQAFDSNGTYLYTIAFFKHPNGAFRMAVHDGILYVKDCRSNIYSLKDRYLLAFHENDSAPMWMHQLDYQASASDYRIRRGSVWRIVDGVESCFIARPASSALYQNNLLFYAALIVVIVIGYLKASRQHKPKHSRIR